MTPLRAFCVVLIAGLGGGVQADLNGPTGFFVPWALYSLAMLVATWGWWEV